MASYTNYHELHSPLISEDHSPKEEHQGKRCKKANLLACSRLLDYNSLLDYSSFNVDPSCTSPERQKNKGNEKKKGNLLYVHILSIKSDPTRISGSARVTQTWAGAVLLA